MTDKTPEKEPENETANGSGDGEQTRTFTQSELDALFADRAKRAGDKAVSTVLKKLGIEDVEMARSQLSEYQKLKKAQMTEAEAAQEEINKLQAERDRAVADKDAAIAKATEQLMKAAVVTEAAKSDYNIIEAARGDVWQFVDTSQIVQDENGNFEGVDKAVKAVVESKPYLVATSSNSNPGTPLRQRLKQSQQPSQQNGQRQKSTVKF